MKSRILGLTSLSAALFAHSAALEAAEVTVIAPDSLMPRFAMGKLEAALQRQAGTLKWTRNQAHSQGAQIVATVDPALISNIGGDGFRRVISRQGLRISAGDERGAMYGVLDVADQIRMGTPSNKIKELTVMPQLQFRAIKFNLLWAAYGSYFAEKLRSGVALATALAKNDPKQQAVATAAMERELAYWKRLAELGGRFNQMPVLSNSKEPFSWSLLTPAVQRDIEISRKALVER